MKPIFVDNTTLSTLARCSTEAVVRYGMGYTSSEDSAALRAGAAGHKCFEIFLKGGTKAEAMSAFRAEYEEWATSNVPPDNRLAFENIETILDCWLDTHPVSGMPYEVLSDMVEVPFVVPLDDAGEFLLTGVLDAVVRHRQTGLLFALDHKTTGQFSQSWVRSYRNGSQMSGYIYALQYLTGEPVDAAFINVIEFKRLPTGGPNLCKTHNAPYVKCGHLHRNKCRVHKVSYSECGNEHARRCYEHGVPYEECRATHAKFEQFMTDRTPYQLEAWRQTAIMLAHRYKGYLRMLGGSSPMLKFLNAQTLPTEGAFTGECTWCPLADWCLSGRRPEMVKGMLVYEPWIDPYTGLMKETAA